MQNSPSEMPAETVGTHETREGTVTIYRDGLVTYEHRETGYREVSSVDELRRKLREKWGRERGSGP